MECPQCHFENPPGSLRCTKCDSDFGLAGATVDSGVVVPTRGGVASGWSRPAERASAVSAAAQALQPGSVLGGRYEILQLLGEGGMGAVYKARDREVDRLVALKVIRPELANQPEVLRRFKQELILARKVTHKNVIRIFDLGEADGIKFISMDFIEGQDLRSLLRQKGKLAPSEATAIMTQVCQALEAAHLEGVVHRDLKPQNIMLDSQGRATVMDFGIARSTEVTGMTQTGALLGTPDYMSPEQAKGQEVDARSDLFTLGIIFYELLTGKTPYQADTLLGTLLKRTQERARPPIELNPTLPRYLNDLVMRCLEISPAARYQSAAEIAKDLEAETAPRPTALRLRLPRIRMVEGHPIRWMAAGLIAVPLIVLAIVFRAKIFAPPVKPTSAPAVSLAIIPFRNASGDSTLDSLGFSLADSLNTDVGQSSSLRLVSSDRLHLLLHDLQLTPESSLDTATLQRLADSTGAQTIVWGQYKKFGEHILIDATLEDLKSGRTVPLKAEAASESGLPGTIDQLAQAIRKNLALSPSLVKELEARAFKPSTQSLPALRDYTQGVQLLREGRNLGAQKALQASTQEDPQFALAYARLAEADAVLGYDDQAELASQKSVGLGENLPAQEKYRIAASHARIIKDYSKAIPAYENLIKVSPNDSDVQFVLAGLYEDTGDFAKARQYYQKVLETNPKDATALLAVGRVESKSGNPKGALDPLNRALGLAIEVDNQEQKALVLQAIGIIYGQLSKPDEALQNYQQSLEIKRHLGFKRGIADSLTMIAQVYDGLGKSDLALRNYNEALQSYREMGDKQDVGDVLLNLGQFYDDRGKYNQALKLFQESLQIQREVGNENYSAFCLNNIGNTYLFKGDYESARTYFEQALQLREKFNVPGDIADTVHNLAEVSTKMGQYDQALTQYLRALELRRKTGDTHGAAIESHGMATIFDYQGRYGAAISSREEALAGLRQLKEQSFWMVAVLGGHGDALSQAGRFADSRKSLDEALSLARQLKNEALTAQSLDWQGDSFFYAGDLKSARPRYEQALPLASKATDRRLLLVSKLNLAKLLVKEGRSQAAINDLRSLSRELDTLGDEYLSVDASLYQAEALLNTKDYPRAQQELEHDLARSEKLGLRTLSAKCHYLLATCLRLTNNGAEATTHYQQALRLLDDIRSQPGAEKVLQRADLNSIYTESTRWSQSAKG